VQVVRTDFGRRMSSKHGTPPFRFPHQADEPLPRIMLTELRERSHECVGQPRGQTRPAQEAPALPMKRGVLASTNLLGEHQPQDMKRAVSYLICSSRVL